MKKQFIFFVALFSVLFLTAPALAVDPVTLEVSNALIYANPGQSFTITFTITNPYPSQNPPSIEKFDLYLRDLNQARVSVSDYQPRDWTHGRIERYDDDHFSKTAFNESTISVTFQVDPTATVGKYPLYGYFNYYGDPVGFSPNDLGETIGPLNDDQNYQYATLVVTKEIVNPITVSPIGDPANFILYAIVLLVILALMAAWWWKNQSKPVKNTSSYPKKRRY